MVNAADASVQDFSGQTPCRRPSVGRTSCQAGQPRRTARTRHDLQVDYFKGNPPETKTPAFALNATGPKVDIALGGVPFSPEQ